MHKIYVSYNINHIYPTPPIYDLHNLQGQVMDFHDLILTLNSRRNSNSCIFCGKIFQIFDPKFSGDTTQKMKFSITDFFSKCDQIHSFLRI